MPRIHRWLAPLLMIVIVLFAFAHLAFTELILARGDTYQYFYPYWDARNAALAAGSLPLWSPDLFMGVPLLANPQIGTFYPPNWALIAFSAPDALRVSIVLHVIWAALGTYLLFWQTVVPRRVPALLAALTFALGGYLGAHVEQINQLQGVSWLPWLLLLYYRLLHDERRPLWIVLMGAAWALQIFSGHTQTVFMTGIALGIFALFHPLPDDRQFWRSRMNALIGLAAVVMLAVLLAIPQLMPALELTGMSNRGGGLTANQATAFSLPPHYLGRALLPSYDGQLFTEYVAFIGVIGLGLMLYGAWTRGKPRRVWLMFALIGVFFALGRFNPIYWLIAELPGFNLFRVPARWLALYALGGAMLAGHGLAALEAQPRSSRRLFVVVLILFGLMLLGAAFGRFLPVQPEDIVGVVSPSLLTLSVWLIALSVFAVLVWFAFRGRALILLSLAVMELLLAARVLPHHDLVPPEVYNGQRFTISQMLAYQQDTGATPSPRFLSLSERQFDPGDLADLRGRYDRLGLDVQAQIIALTAVKNQELIAPNLALTWGIPSVDGYGGGLLPTIYYSQFTSLMLPPEMLRTLDGRLGEMLALPACRGACLPDATWLDLTDTGYLITDKVFDVVHDGIFYDTTLADRWTVPPPRPDFDFTEIRVLYQGAQDSIESQSFTFNDQTYQVAIVDWAAAVQMVESGMPLLALTAVDTRTGDFLQLMPAGWERVLSSDIKLYRRSTPQRALLVYDLPQQAIFPDDWQGHEDVIAALQAGEIDIALHGEALPLSASTDAQASIIWNSYTPNRLELTVTTAADAYLYLAEAYYPGWRATINDEPAAIHRANVMFRAVRIPAGESLVVFEFVPSLWYTAMAIGAALWSLALIVIGWFWWHYPATVMTSRSGSR